jgi:hypothetical protein
MGSGALLLARCRRGRSNSRKTGTIGSTSPGTAENYAWLIKKVYPRIKTIDPSIIVYGGAMTPTGVVNRYLEKMLAAGTLPFMDVVSIHTYNYSKPGRERTPEA